MGHSSGLPWALGHCASTASVPRAALLVIGKGWTEECEEFPLAAAADLGLEFGNGQLLPSLTSV